MSVVVIGNQQFWVNKGDKIFVPKQQEEVGSTITLKEIALINGDKTTINLSNSVSAKIIDHVKGEKIKVFKKKRRKRYRRTNGHRQQFTQIEIL